MSGICPLNQHVPASSSPGSYPEVVLMLVHLTSRILLIMPQAAGVAADPNEAQAIFRV